MEKFFLSLVLSLFVVNSASATPRMVRTSSCADLNLKDASCPNKEGTAAQIPPAGFKCCNDAKRVPINKIIKIQ